MRKFSLLSLLLVMVLVLSACTNADSNGNGTDLGTPGVEGTDVSGAMPTDSIPVTGETVVATEPVMTEVVTEEVVTQEPVATETVDDDMGVVEEGLDDVYPNLLSEVLDLEIMTNECEELAEIDGVVVSQGDGKILYVVGVTGGAFELDEEVLIPFAALDYNHDIKDASADDSVDDTAGEAVCDVFERGEGFVLNVASDDLSGIPSVVTEDGGDLGDVVVNDTWDDELRSFWSNLGVQVSEAVDADVASGVETAGNTVVIRDVGELNLSSLTGDDIGDIHDFIVDAETGTITHVILEVGGFLGIGERFVPVPMSAVNWNAVDDGFGLAIDADAERLEMAPGFDSLDEFPDIYSDGWDSEFESYWVTPGS